MGKIELNFKDDDERLRFNLVIKNKNSGIYHKIYENTVLEIDEEMLLTYTTNDAVFERTIETHADFNVVLDQLIFDIIKYYHKKRNDDLDIIRNYFDLGKSITDKIT